MDLLEVERHLGQFVNGRILYMESMRKHTSWRVGGPADIMVQPSSQADIIYCVNFAREHQIPLTVMGNGSNMLVRDQGIRGIVLKIFRGFNNSSVEGSVLSAQAGALLPVLARQAAAQGLSGLEFAAGIPASVGGAVRMNAGAHGRSLDQLVRYVKILDEDGRVLCLEKEEMGFQYRKSSIADRQLIVLEAGFNLTPDDPQEIKARNATNLAKRRRSQPLEYPNAGSVFANPPGGWAGWLIDQVGGKGMRVGDAVVSEKHANFIINQGNASAADILELIDHLKQLVHDNFKVELELEVQVVGD